MKLNYRDLGLSFGEKIWCYGSGEIGRKNLFCDLGEKM